MATEEILAATYAARDRFASGLGAVDPDVLAPLINPSFTGGPRWPDLRQAWRVVRGGAATIFLSDGLSDPFSDEDGPNIGFGLEILGETDDGLPDQLQASWLFDLVYHVSQQCADHGGVADLIGRIGLISLELPASDTLAPAASANGSAGVLLGVPAPGYEPHFDVPGGPVVVVTAKLLWPSELAYAAAGGAAARAELARLFAADGTHHRSSMARAPAV